MLEHLVPTDQRRTLDELTDKLDLSVGQVTAKRSAFWIMLVLSGVIAISGVIGDSSATVIGAMIVAPLSTPILGVALGVVTGRSSLIGRSLLLVTGGVVVVVVLGFLFAQLLPNPGNVLSNAQVLGRTSPTLMDLTAALATGLVAAVAVTRRDVGDVLPGVAIAISLVPPLGVVGVCLGSEVPSLAFGAFVLFASNVLAMIIMVTTVLLIAGYASDADASTARRGRAYLVLGAAMVLVVVPLVINSLSSLWAGQIADAARDWLRDEPGAQVVDVTLHGDTATVAVLGPDPLPSVQQLQSSVDDLMPWNPNIVIVHTVGARLQQER
ncbi:DUF389 domain-containing protein [Rhodococcus sp. BGS-1C]|uniref:DUF389 domain-containing protein n=1 Tax=unclassified Rhodococcus (in: high G+C Gram-positive bacteria) TaxID=192944 RepID=UPI00095DD99A|nr:DUF389 domain-containing protein [Rhodococcus sp. KRD197]OLT37515.1 hypothetical protein BJF84_06315 [Rhodococcus sp. CUA-806]